MSETKEATAVYAGPAFNHRRRISLAFNDVDTGERYLVDSSVYESFKLAIYLWTAHIFDFMDFDKEMEQEEIDRAIGEYDLHVKELFEDRHLNRQQFADIIFDLAHIGKENAEILKGTFEVNLDNVIIGFVEKE